MVVILDTNTHMGIFHIQKMPTFCTPNFNLLSGFMLSKRPNCSFGLMKTDKSLGVIHNCGRISVVLKGGGSDEGGVIEKELEFKPSFDEYLKAMESVQTVREKRKQSKIQTRKIEENINLGVLEKSEMKITIKDNSSVANVGGLRRNDYVVSVEGGLDNNVERSKSVWLNARNKSGVSKGGAKKMGFIEKSNEGNAKELDFRSSGDDAKVEKKLGVEARIGRWTDNQRGGVRETQRYDIEGGRAYAQSAPQRVRVDSVGKRGYRDNGDDELVTDRAAFRSLEEYNDIDDKPRVSRLDMEERIQKLAKSLNGADIDMPEWMFSRMMRSAKIRFADHSMLRVIQILGKYGNWRRVLQVIEWIQSRERFKSHKLRFIYTAALDALGKARRPVEALNLYHTMQQQMSTYPDLVAYHCIAVTLGQAGHMKELFDVIDSMQSPPKKKFETGVIGKWDPRLKPDIVVYNAVLNACVHRKKWEGAFWVLKQMKEEGQQPTTTTYGLIMEVMFACGKYSMVHDFYKKIHKSANALSYKVLVNTHWKEGNMDMAVRVVKEMEGRGIIGSGGLYYDLARGLCSVGRSQEALMLIDKICRVANRPLVVTYTGLIQTCLECGNIRDGANIFKHMHKFCSPNLVTCNIMLKAYLDHEMFEEAKVLFQKLVESGNHISSKSDYKDRVIPDNHTFNLMLDACALQQRWEDLEFTYRKMLQHEYHFNAKRHLRMVLDACRAGKTELLEITWKHLVEADRVPPPLLVKQMFFLKLKQEDYSGAFACVTNHPSCELPEFSKKSWLRFFKENSDKLQQGILVGLVHEISNIFARSDSSNLILENLNTACREFLRIHMKGVDFEQSLTF